ncbi:MAG: serine--tRNA ligase [Candidatus Staskawiczbacteria bacterium]|jgi:seryl-tRNA synthetase
MLDINFIRQNPQIVKDACQKKQVIIDIDKLLDLDKKRREITTQLDSIRAEQNKISKQNNPDLIAKAKELKEKIKVVEPTLALLEKELNILMLTVPNIPFDDVPVGKDDSGNVVVEKIGKTPNFKFQSKDYLEIGEKLGIIDVQRASKVAGSRFGYLKAEAAIIEFALIRFGLDILAKEGFVPVIPPVMLKSEMARGTGYFEATDEKEAYFLPEDDLYLVGTSEQSLIAMHAGEILEGKETKRYVGFSTCFRREAGSYGKDTKGILRVHQFDKLEMVVFCKPENSKNEHELLLSLEKKLMKTLGLPFQVVNICTGDLGRPAAAKYDIETWVPSEKKYRETHSTSNCTDFQARRLNIRYRDKSGKLNFIHTLNGTGFAIGRILIAILENYQQKDGSVKIPKALQKYTGFKEIKLKS